MGETEVEWRVGGLAVGVEAQCAECVLTFSVAAVSKHRSLGRSLVLARLEA